MKFLINFIRVFVGVLFIFSGLIKANDPNGLSYKMQEFFEVWGWHFMHDITLPTAILMNVFEIAAGVALIIGWQIKWVNRLLLLLILFFTFLTGYAVLSGKIKSCGCFGDCLPLTAEMSFGKDLLLLVLISLLIWKEHLLEPWASRFWAILFTLLSIVASIAVQLIVLQQLPFLDCLPYKKGTHIATAMKIPAGAIPDSVVIEFVYDKQGKEVVFTADAFPADFDESIYQFKERRDKVVRKGNAEPPIKDFSLKTQSGNDTTQLVLEQTQKSWWIFLKDANTVPATLNRNWPEFSRQLALKHQKALLITATPFDQVAETLRADSNLVIVQCDGVAIKTAARVSPTIYAIQSGKVLQKWAGINWPKQP